MATKRKAAKKKSTRRRKSSGGGAGLGFRSMVSNARKVGYKKKKPKVPKRKTPQSVEKYNYDVSQWEKDVRAHNSIYKKFESTKLRAAKL